MKCELDQLGWVFILLQTEYAPSMAYFAQFTIETKS